MRKLNKTKRQDSEYYKKQKYLNGWNISLKYSKILQKNIDNAPNHQLESLFQSAITTFVLVRGLSTAIPVFQGTEVAIEHSGVWVVLTSGQILDLVNDLTERFSWVVLAPGTSLGAQIIF